MWRIRVRPRTRELRHCMIPSAQVTWKLLSSSWNSVVMLMPRTAMVGCLCIVLAMVKFLMEHGAYIFTMKHSDHETAVEGSMDARSICIVFRRSWVSCLEVLFMLCLTIQLSSPMSCFKAGQQLRVLRKGDENEREWW